MNFAKVVVGLAFLTSGMLFAQQAKVTQLMSKDLTNIPGKEGLMISVEYPPGSSDPVHRHYAHAFVYVLEGSIEVHLQFYTSVVLNAGQGISLDSSMGHAYVAKDCESALVLAVCSGEDVNLACELMRLAESESVEA